MEEKRVFMIGEDSLKSVISYLDRTNLPHQEVKQLIELLANLDVLEENTDISKRKGDY